MKRGLLAALLTVFAVGGAPLKSEAAAPAGSIIRNQAEATYFSPSLDRSFLVTSTISTVRVKSSPDYELFNDNSIEASPDESVVFPHLLINTGNEADSYELSAIPLGDAGALRNIAIYLDVNENGALDAEDPAIERTDTLVPGATVALLVSGRISTSALQGQSFQTELSARSEMNASNVQTRMDTAVVRADTVFRIRKNAFPACSTPILPGSVIDYDVDMLNLDGLSAAVADYQIDGVTTAGVLIEDTIPANTTLVASTMATFSPSSARLVVRDVLASQSVLRNYAAYAETDRIRSVGLFVPADSLLTGQSARFEFQVRVNAPITPGTVISNAIAVDTDGDGTTDVLSNETCNTVDSDGNSAELRFLEPSSKIRREISTGARLAGPVHPQDADFQDAPVYRLDTYPGYMLARDGVYVEVRSTALNASAFEKDERVEARFIRVRVQSATSGDTIFVRLLETAPNSGVFRAEVPFALSTSVSGQGRDCAPDTPDQCVLRSASGDSLQATIFDPGTRGTLQDFAVVDPQGVVFDSTSLEPVEGAIVTILDSSGAIAIDPDSGALLAAQTTGPGGVYTIPRLESGAFAIRVAPPENYSFPSIVQPTVFAGRRSVADPSYGATGYDGVQGSGLFASDFSQVSPVIDIPLDPDLNLGQLALTKEADREVVSFGDMLEYTLTLKNGTDAVLLGVEIVDAPASGFRYVDGSAKLDGSGLDVERGPDPRSLTFPVGRLEIGETATVTYVLQVGPEARQGDLVNVAVAMGETGGGVPARSPRARETVKISDEGFFSDRAYLIGSVWADADGDGLRGEDEVGLPGARIWLEDGTWVETDELGRYSLYGLNPGTRVARLDPVTLPEGYFPSRDRSRQMYDGEVRIVDLLAGELHRADFPLACPEETACGQRSAFATFAAERAARQSPDAMLDQALAFEGLIGEDVSRDLSRLREQPGADGDISNGRITLAGAPGLNSSFDGPGPEEDTSFDASGAKTELSGPPSPEEAAAQLGRMDVKSGEWLWPLPDARTGKAYARDGRIMVAVRSGLVPQLIVNGEPVSNEQLGELIANSQTDGQVAAWYGVELREGENLLEVTGEDMFGNVRQLGQTTVYRPGAPARLETEPPIGRLAADGRTRARLVLRQLDADGHPASGNSFLTVFADIPGVDTPVQIVGQDVQPDQPGHQVRLRDGAAIIEIISPDQPSTVSVRMETTSGLRDEMELKFNSPSRDLIAVGLIDISGRKFDVSGGLEPADAEAFPQEMNLDGRVAFFLKGKIKGGALLTMAYDSEASRRDGLFRDIDPEAYYPIYGDASEKGFEAQSRSKLYVKLETENTTLMWGDYRSDAFLEESLVRVRRALTGFNAQREIGPWRLQGFAAEAEKGERTERIRGRGLALDIVLPGAPLVRNSEILTIEVRDRNNPGLVISEEPLQRFADYLLDEFTGNLTLKSPLPSVDENGNPVYLLASYEVDTDEEGALVAGFRIEREVENGLVRVGVSLDDSQIDVKRKVMGSVGYDFVFGAGQGFVEIGVMDNNSPEDIHERGGAFRAGIEARLGSGLLTAVVAQAGEYYDNPDAPILAGRRETRAEYLAALSDKADVRAELNYSENLISNANRFLIQSLLVVKDGPNTLSFGPRYTRDTTAEETLQFPSIVLRVDRLFDYQGVPGTTFVEIERALGENRTRVDIGGDAQVRDDTRVYLTHRLLDEIPEGTFAPGLTASQFGIGQQRTLLGIESRIIPNTDVYGEWREPSALDSRTGEAAYGIRSLWEITEGLSISPHMEIVNAFDEAGLEEEAAAQVTDSFSLSLALADRTSKVRRRAARVEMRDTDSSTFFGARLGWAERFTPLMTGAAKFDYARDNLDLASDQERLRLTLGLARRPARADETDWFATYQWYAESQDGEKRRVDIGSFHANRQFGQHWTLAGRGAAKWEDTYGQYVTAQLLGARLTYDIHQDWDVEVRGSLRSADWGDAFSRSYGVAASWRPREDTRLTLGYNFAGFRDRDLDPRGYDAEGIYWQIAITIDEDWFGFLQPQG